MKRHVLMYGLIGGILIALLQWTEYQFLVVEHSIEIYGGLIAATFAVLGIWLGLKLTAKRQTIVVRELPVAAEGPFSRTLLLVYMHGEELRTNGKSEAEIKADVANGYKEGRYQYPSKPGFLYMMSSRNRLSAIPEHGTGIFPPHLMFYAPNMATKDIGFDAEPNLDYLGMTHPGAGDNLIVVIPAASKSPADVAGR
jgi:hypothetical protein